MAETTKGGLEAEEFCGQEEVVGEAVDEVGGMEFFEGVEACTKAGEVECGREWRRRWWFLPMVVVVEGFLLKRRVLHEWFSGSPMHLWPLCKC